MSSFIRIEKDTEDLCEGGDLGLGRGLKPGGIPNTDLLEENEALQTSRHLTQASRREDRQSVPSARPKDVGFGTVGGRFKNASDASAAEDFPAFAEVPFGTSLRQQRKLYEQKLNEIFPSSLDSDDENSEEDVTRVTSNDKLVLILQEKLREAENDVELLRQDLEVCKQQLQSKYLALKALQKQNCAVQSQQQDKTQKAKQVNKQLIQELNGLQFQLDYQQSSLMDAQNLWVDRFNRVCSENNALMATLEARSEQMRSMTAEKMAVERERDELLALLDVQERQRYELTRSHAQAEEQAYNNFTSSELAVLGACRCRHRDPQPCGCAHAAAYMKREICKLRDELENERDKSENASVTADAYRMAFEEQLSRNRSLVKKITDLVALPGGQPSRTSRAKAALKWLIKQLNEDESVMLPSKRHATSRIRGSSDNSKMHDHSEEHTVTVNGSNSPDTDALDPGYHDNGYTVDVEELNTMNQPELIGMLTDMISDRSEALAHQRLAARLLAKRTKELEEKLTAITESDDTFAGGATK